MADEKYSIDEILKEIDSARGAGKQKKSTRNSSANSFDDTDEIDKLINSNKNSKPVFRIWEDGCFRPRLPDSIIFLQEGFDSCISAVL